MASRAAVVDVGSGTTTVAVFDAGVGGFLDRVLQEGHSLRLIERIDARGRLSRAASKQLLETVAEYVLEARAAGAEQVEVVATSAMREAHNGAELVADLGRIPCVNARLVSGEEEAQLAAHTVLCTLPLNSGVVIDLGGGSLQLARVVRRRVVDSVSLPLGALRLSDAFLLGADPPGAAAVCELRRRVVEHFRTVPWLRGHGGTLVAVGGSARSLGKIERRARSWPVGHGHGYFLDGEYVLDCYEQFARQASAERRGTPGLPEHRTDTILAAALILSTLLRVGGFGGMYLSTYGIREGVAFHALFGDRPVADPSAAGIRGRLGAHVMRRPPTVPWLSPRERRLYAAALGHPIDALLAKPIQGFWQEEILRVASALRRNGA